MSQFWVCSCVWHGWVIHRYDVTVSYVRHGRFIHMYDMTHSCSESSHMSSECLQMCDTADMIHSHSESSHTTNANENSAHPKHTNANENSMRTKEFDLLDLVDFGCAEFSILIGICVCRILHTQNLPNRANQIPRYRFKTTISIWIYMARYQGIWVSRFRGFRGCSIFSGNCQCERREKFKYTCVNWNLLHLNSQIK